jgi:molybdopterin/thiamine biosynthesis adenylyltransferase
MAADRYARQVLALGETGQAAIAASRVAVVGLGGLGSHVAQGLAYLGVRDFVLVDDDRVDETNLNRLIGAGPVDVGMPKVEVAARTIRSVSPDASVRTIEANLCSREALDLLFVRPIIFGCVDNDGARLILTELAAAYRVTLIDLAVEILIGDEAVGRFDGRVVVARPGDYCLFCADQIDRELAKRDLESESIQRERERHGYGLGPEIPAPAVVSLNGVVAHIALNEFLALTTALRAPERHVTYHGMRQVITRRVDGRKSNCYICGYLVGKEVQANLLRYVVDE